MTDYLYEAVHEAIKHREKDVLLKHREIDALYEKYGTSAKYAGVDKLHRDTEKLYGEILTLKLVVIAAQDKERVDDERTGKGVPTVPS